MQTNSGGFCRHDFVLPFSSLGGGGGRRRRWSRRRGIHPKENNTIGQARRYVRLQTAYQAYRLYDPHSGAGRNSGAVWRQLTGHALITLATAS